MAGRSDGVTVMIVPRGKTSRGTRSFNVSGRRWRVMLWTAGIAVVLWVAMAISWWYVASQALRVPALKSEIATLEMEQAQVEALAARLVQMEERYNRLRVMVGPERADGQGTTWLPSGATGEPGAGSQVAVDEGSDPDAWPLTQRGFITRGHLTDVVGQHPGLDIAVAEGSYIRSAGSGRVLEAGEDTIYGRFIRIQHGQEYETMYGHASAVFVESGDVVERHELIGLTGSTGRSTAPHLHFEVIRDGEPIDPRLVVDAPYGS